MFISDSVWVSASAGTGKTKNLIDRIIALLVHGVQPSKILCLTYTKNATAEMLERLNNCVTKWRGDSDEDVKNDLRELKLPQELYRRAKQLYLKSTTEKWVRVQTIHGFCQELISMYPLESGVMPESKVLDDTYPLLRMAYTRVLNNTKYHADLKFILKYKASVLDIIAENFHDIRNFFSHYEWDSSPDLYNQFFMVNSDSEADILSKLCTQHHKELIEKIKPYFPNEIDILDAFPSFDITKIFLTSEGKQNTKILKSAATKDVSEYISELSELACELNENRNRLLISRMNTAFMNIASEVIRQYEAIKAENNAIDFDDIILKANYIMKKYDYVRQAVDSMLDHVLVDEAQDTSAIQWDVIKSITGDFFYHENSEKTIFVVGDKKQSIYSFQGADFALFASMHYYFKQKVEACGQKWRDICLNTSYRSGQAIIDFVNKSFLSTFPDSEHFTSRSGTKSQVIVHPVYQINDDVSLATVARDIALSIKEMIDSRTFLPSKQRAATPRDFMILSQRRSELHSLISNELKKLNIPCSGSDKINLKEELIIEDLISIAKFSVFQSDDLNLAIILKNPIFDLSEEELFQICTERGDKSIWTYISENCADHRAFIKLNQYIQNSHLPPYEFFMKLVEYGDIELLAAKCGNNSLEAFNLFLDICKQYPGPASISSFIRWYNDTEFVTKKDKLSTENAVTIMTVHGSKGLQAPVVILVDTAFVNMKYSPIVNCGNDFIFLNHSDFATARVNDILEVIKEKDNAESKRLLYVATTRAEDVLSIYAHTSLKNINQNAWYSVLGGEQKLGQTLDTDINGEYCATDVSKSYPTFDNITFTENKSPVKTQPEIYGDFVHFLLEKLPDMSKTHWDEFISSQCPQLSDEDKQFAIKEAVNVINTFPDIFNNSIASELEVSINGHLRRIDKVCMINDEIYVIDFKTGYEESSRYKKQISEYKKILSSVFPTHTLRAFTLWTKSLDLIEESAHDNSTLKNSDKCEGISL